MHFFVKSQNGSALRSRPAFGGPKDFLCLRCTDSFFFFDIHSYPGPPQRGLAGNGVYKGRKGRKAPLIFFEIFMPLGGKFSAKACTQACFNVPQPLPSCPNPNVQPILREAERCNRSTTHLYLKKKAHGSFGRRCMDFLQSSTYALLLLVLEFVGLVGPTGTKEAYSRAIKPYRGGGNFLVMAPPCPYWVDVDRALFLPLWETFALHNAPFSLCAFGHI